eukprot:3225346-Rhodomonas_salina.2
MDIPSGGTSKRYKSEDDKPLEFVEPWGKRQNAKDPDAPRQQWPHAYHNRYVIPSDTSDDCSSGHGRIKAARSVSGLTRCRLGQATWACHCLETSDLSNSLVRP